MEPRAIGEWFWLPIFEHFTDGIILLSIRAYRLHHKNVLSICCFTITSQKYQQNWLYVPQESAWITYDVILIVCTLKGNSYGPLINVWEFWPSLYFKVQWSDSLELTETWSFPWFQNSGAGIKTPEFYWTLAGIHHGPEFQWNSGSFFLGGQVSNEHQKWHLGSQKKKKIVNFSLEKFLRIWIESELTHHIIFLLFHVIYLKAKTSHLWWSFALFPWPECLI